MNRRGLFILIWFLSFIFTNVKAEDSTNYYVVRDLQDEWLVYDKDYKSYFPLLDDKAEMQISSASLLLDLRRYKEYQLEFMTNPGLAIFVEKELVYESSDTRRIVHLPIKNFPNFSGNSKSVLTFYSQKGVQTLDKIAIVKPVSFRSENLIQSMIIYPRYLNNLGTLYTLTFLFILGGLVFIKNRFSKKFYEFLGISSVLPSMDENPLWDIMSAPILILIAINSFCVSLILFVIKREYDLESLGFLNIFAHQAVLGVLLVGLLIFLIYMVKYLQIKLTGWIFNLNEIVKIQFFELMKVSLKVNFLLTILILFFYSSGIFNVNFQFQYFLYFALFTLLIVLFRVGYLVFAYSKFRNVYLFSYLCATEILPLVIIIKLILF